MTGPARGQVLFHLLESDDADAGLDRPALTGISGRAAAGCSARPRPRPSAAGPAARCSSACRPWRRAGRPSPSICARLSRGRASGICRRTWYNPPADRTVHHRANRREAVAVPCGSRPVRAPARGLVTDQCLAGRFVTVSASSRPAIRAPSRTAALTSVRIDLGGDRSLGLHGRQAQRRRRPRSSRRRAPRSSRPTSAHSPGATRCPGGSRHTTGETGRTASRSDSIERPVPGRRS